MQQGETGEGRIVQQMKKAKLIPSEDYLEALELFIKEEGRHAKLLGLALKSLGFVKVNSSFSTQLFTQLRNWTPAFLKLLVLFAAEAMAVLFYGCLSERLYGTPLGKILKEIHEDEKSHLQFHTDYFKYSQFSFIQKFLSFTLFSIGTIASFLVLYIDHHKTMDLLNIDTYNLWEDLHKIRKEIWNEII